MQTTKREIVAGVYYTPNPTHRNQTPRKSQWLIDIPQEELAFSIAYNRNWIVDGEKGWGFHFEDGQAMYLGLDEDHRTEVFLAKFVNDLEHNNWHGYPVNHQRKPQDIPHISILNQWLNEEPIPARKIRKIMRAQPCKL